MFHIFYSQSLSFQKITRVITTVDSQPTFDGGVLINVLGRLQVRIPLSLAAKADQLRALR